MKARTIEKLILAWSTLPIPQEMNARFRVKELCIGANRDPVWNSCRRSGVLPFVGPFLDNFPIHWDQLFARRGVKTHQIKNLNVVIRCLMIPNYRLSRSRVEKY